MKVKRKVIQRKTKQIPNLINFEYQNKVLVTGKYTYKEYGTDTTLGNFKFEFDEVPTIKQVLDTFNSQYCNKDFVTNKELTLILLDVKYYALYKSEAENVDYKHKLVSRLYIFDRTKVTKTEALNFAKAFNLVWKA